MPHNVTVASITSRRTGRAGRLGDLSKMSLPIGCRFPGPDRESRIGRVRHSSLSLWTRGAAILSPGILAAVTCHTPAPPVPPPAVRRTGERGVVMALPDRTPPSQGKNRVSGEISCEFPGLAGRAGIARLYRPGTMLTAAIQTQPAAGAEVGLAGALHGIGAWVPQPLSTGVNVTSITRRRAEQAGRLGDPDNTPLWGRLPFPGPDRGSRSAASYVSHRERRFDHQTAR